MKASASAAGQRVPVGPYPRQGEVYLVRLPGHPEDTKERPALIVSMDVRNRLAGDVIVVPLTTTLRSAPTHVELAPGEGGLYRPSMAKCEQVTTIDKSFLIRGPFEGRVNNPTMRAVEKAILRAIGIPAQ